jgi:hypothetical protein
MTFTIPMEVFWFVFGWLSGWGLLIVIGASAQRMKRPKVAGQ